MSYTLHAHAHSCCEIRGKRHSLLCDPWLLGSAYWRSWWNFPPQESLESLLSIWSQLDTLYVYITHLHWDHFHGPTLKRLIKQLDNIHFLLPLTPERRLSNDLRQIIKSIPLTELSHARFYYLAPSFRVLSFQSGPFFADSALFVDAGGSKILNANDSKFGRMAFRDLLRKTGSPMYALRSHSSANYRACKKNLDGSPYLYPADKSGAVYSSEFFEFCSQAGASYAVPFASNICYLHRETFEHNSLLNSSDVAVEYCSNTFQNKSTSPLLLLPGESISLISHQICKSAWRRNLLSRDRVQVLSEYAQSKSSCLNKQYIIEDKAVPNLRAIKSYLSSVIKYCPFPIRLYLRRHVYIHIKSERVSLFVYLDFLSKSLRFLDVCPTFSGSDVCFVIHPFVINDVCRSSHFNSLGVSKRLSVLARQGNNRDAVFNYLCNTYEAEGILDPSVLISLRFWVVWMRRLPEVFDMLFLVLRSVALSAIRRFK
ncbi:beta-lactamase superfamily domain protein [Synechococcus sp. SYN20]|uniref:MBL fold metallo-hydrolase n=1 Tax=Synechococcus sp. SYN20 TaxID=1050714 RepID=UPI001648431F|nr:MBL fold metallo-hydrolase [Synechococcus sp. SYN20]QNJ24570.1 beta-lactamase superfamily domain protein [Synechococcus sp. SYN20]